MALLQQLHQLHQEQLELANSIEIAKHTLKKEGFAIKETINEVITSLVRNLLIFLTCHIILCRGGDGGFFDLLALKLVVLWWFAFLCRITYQMIDGKIEEMDELLQRDASLKRSVDNFARIVRDSFNIYRVTGQFTGGPAVALDVRVFPQIVDHGECVSRLALLKQLVEEPSVLSNYRVTYRLLVLALSLFAILFVIGLAVIPNYALEGDAHLSREYLNFAMLSQT